MRDWDCGEMCAGLALTAAGCIVSARNSAAVPQARRAATASRLHRRRGAGLSPGHQPGPARRPVAAPRRPGAHREHRRGSYAFAPRTSPSCCRTARTRASSIAPAPRALRRTLLAEADMSYLLRPDHVPGGVGTYSASALAEMVETNLLGDGIFDPGQPLQGYVVVDTGQALMSLDGASFEVIARRLGDDRRPATPTNSRPRPRRHDRHAMTTAASQRTVGLAARRPAPRPRSGAPGGRGREPSPRRPCRRRRRRRPLPRPDRRGGLPRPDRRSPANARSMRCSATRCGRRSTPWRCAP